MTPGAVVDMDGTVRRGGEVVPGAERGLAALREAGYRPLFVSNNPTRSPAAFAADLRGAGLSVDADAVLTSAVVTREYLRRTHPDGTAFVVGEAGFRRQLDGVDLTTEPAAADVLVASIDRSFDYADLTAALRALEDGVTAFVGTDPDATVPSGSGPIPGTGAVVGAIAAATGRDPDRVLGKPFRPTVEAVRRRLGGDPALVVGDRPDTDVALGRRTGARTVLVRTGVAGDGTDASPAPDAVVDSLADLGTALARQ